MKKQENLNDSAAALEIKAAEARENTRVRSVMAVVLAGLCVIFTVSVLAFWVCDGLLSVIGLVGVLGPAAVTVLCVAVGVILFVLLLLAVMLYEVFPPIVILYALILAILISVAAVGEVSILLIPSALATIVSTIAPVKIALELVGVISAIFAIVLSVVTFIISGKGKERAAAFSGNDMINPDLVMYRVARIASRVCIITLTAVLVMLAVTAVINAVLTLLTVALLIVLIVLLMFPGLMISLL